MDTASISLETKIHKSSPASILVKGFIRAARLMLFILASVLDANSQVRREARRIAQHRYVGWGD